jgi:hypothetical protein
MDPYIERPEIWPDFHDSLIAAIRGLLQPLLRPRYAAITQERLYVVEAERPIRPDVSVVRTSVERPQDAGTALLERDAPAVFELWREEIRQPLIHIVEPAAGNRLSGAAPAPFAADRHSLVGRGLGCHARSASCADPLLERRPLS